MESLQAEKDRADHRQPASYPNNGQPWFTHWSKFWRETEHVAGRAPQPIQLHDHQLVPHPESYGPLLPVRRHVTNQVGQGILSLDASRLNYRRGSGSQAQPSWSRS